MKPMSFDFKSRRSMILAKRGMVASENPLSAQAGLAILRAGGNAADAAIAAAAVMNVTAPASTGAGGDCFALYYDAKTGVVTALNGSGRAPSGLTIEHLTKAGMSGEIPPRSVHAATVPGAVRGWEDLLNRFGTMTFREVLQDAIHYAEIGSPVTPVFGEAWIRSQAFLKGSHNTEDYLPNRVSPQVGDMVKLKGLAKTFRAMVEGGADAFYLGDTGRAIVSTLEGLGGTMTLTDLKSHISTWDDSIYTDYHGITIHEHPPNGQGLAALQALAIAESLGLADMAWDDPQRIHLMVEAMRLAFADARQYIADPAMSRVPVGGLLDPAYIAGRRAMIDPNRAMHPSFGIPPNSSDTIYLCVVDGEGNACSFINSLYMGFGTGIVAKGTGVFLQNRGANFVLDANHANALMPNKRPYHTIIPGLATKDGKLWGTFGVMGGFMQPQGHFQVISAMVDDHINPQEALDRPRWCLESGYSTSMLALEEGIPFKTLADLARMGHHVHPVSGANRALFGSGQIIYRDSDSGVLFGGSDPRKDGQVAGF
ncbi:MAG: gamma-glutamyltransferase family protein [Phototrophicales bacterium]|nr:gamma-glutamyltransferase family protein [Phototrophicales bacterium]